MNYWILITNVHQSDTWIPEDGEYTYEIAPNSEINRGDTVYLWWNPYSEFYGWGEVAQPPRTITVERPAPDSGIDTVRRTSVVVNRKAGFHPHITAADMQQDPNLRKFIP